MPKSRRKGTTRAPSAKQAKAASRAAKKGWETRKANARAAARAERARERARTQAQAAAKERARKGWETRRAKELARAQATLQRQLAGKRGARIRRHKERAREALQEMLTAGEQGAPAPVWNPLKESWHEAKADLLVAVDGDYDRYLELLEEIADETDCDWDIYYGESEG